jgi:hypothetical protein
VAVVLGQGVEKGKFAGEAPAGAEVRAGGTPALQIRDGESRPKRFGYRKSGVARFRFRRCLAPGR